MRARTRTAKERREQQLDVGRVDKNKISSLTCRMLSFSDSREEREREGERKRRVVVVGAKERNQNRTEKADRREASSGRDDFAFFVFPSCAALLSPL